MNNYTEKQLVEIVEKFKKMNMNYFIGEEIAPTTGTPHLQGYCEGKKVFRPFASFKKISNKIHWEKCKGDRASNTVYCGKDDKLHTNMVIPVPLDKIERNDLRQEQLDIADKFIEREHKFGRKIYWYWENKGNWGKTILATYMVDQMHALVVGGKAADAAYAVQMYLKNNGTGPKIIIMDVPRTRSTEYISYEAIENIKNGMFFSSKYEGGMVRYNRPHVIVFANEPPETHRMSQDRWEITELTAPQG